MSFHQQEIDKLDFRIQGKLHQYFPVANAKNYPGLLFSIAQVRDLLKKYLDAEKVLLS